MKILQFRSDGALAIGIGVSVATTSDMSLRKRLKYGLSHCIYETIKNFRGAA